MKKTIDVRKYKRKGKWVKKHKRRLKNRAYRSVKFGELRPGIKATARGTDIYISDLRGASPDETEKVIADLSFKTAINREKMNLNEAKRRKKYPEKVKAATKKWREANPERHAAMKKAWWDANPEKKREANKKYYLGNLEKFIEQRKKEKIRYRTDPDYRVKKRELMRKNTQTKKYQEWLKNWQKEYNQREEVKERRRIHEVVKKNKPKPDKCELCKTNKPSQLSHKTHDYTTKLKEWQWACRDCHIEYDKMLGDKKLGVKRVRKDESKKTHKKER